MLQLKQLIAEMVESLLLEDEKIHKNPETREDRHGNTSEMSIEKGATIVTDRHSPGRYKQYAVHGYEHKKGLVYFHSKPDVMITHHRHDLKKGDPGLISPDMNERMKTEGQFRVSHKEHHMSDKIVHKLFKTGSAAKKYAIEKAKDIHNKKVSNAKAASEWGYTGKYASVYRNRPQNNS
jgi:hypothetical protein